MKQQTFDNSVFHFFNMLKSSCTGMNIFNTQPWNNKSHDSVYISRFFHVFFGLDCIIIFIDVHIDTWDRLSPWMQISHIPTRNVSINSLLLFWRKCSASLSSQDGSRTCPPVFKVRSVYKTTQRYSSALFILHDRLQFTCCLEPVMHRDNILKEPAAK